MWKQQKEQSHAQCHVRDQIRLFDKISEHVKVANSADFAAPEGTVTVCHWKYPKGRVHPAVMRKLTSLSLSSG